jgi:hypothetical protein
MTSVVPLTPCKCVRASAPEVGKFLIDKSNTSVTIAADVENSSLSHKPRDRCQAIRRSKWKKPLRTMVRRSAGSSGSEGYNGHCTHGTRKLFPTSNRLDHPCLSTSWILALVTGSILARTEIRSSFFWEAERKSGNSTRRGHPSLTQEFDANARSFGKSLCTKLVRDCFLSSGGGGRSLQA